MRECICHFLSLSPGIVWVPLKHDNTFGSRWVVLIFQWSLSTIDFNTEFIFIASLIPIPLAESLWSGNETSLEGGHPLHHLYHIIVVLPSDPGRRGCRLSVAMADGSIGYFTTEIFQCQKKVACECGECVCGGDREGSVCMAVCGCSVCVCVCQGKRGFSTLQKLYVCLFLTPSFFHPHTHTHTHTHPHTHTPSHTHL